MDDFTSINLKDNRNAICVTVETDCAMHKVNNNNNKKNNNNNNRNIALWTTLAIIQMIRNNCTIERQPHCNLRYCGNGSPYAQSINKNKTTTIALVHCLGGVFSCIFP